MGLTRAVVFGEVVTGQEVVKAVEALGSQSGKTKGKITITDVRSTMPTQADLTVRHVLGVHSFLVR